jgi:formylglycine-generating enzyme required for sulfatase activity
MNVRGLLHRSMMIVLGAAAVSSAPWAVADDWPGPVGPPPKGFEMVKIPGGCYEMGNSPGVGEDNERPKHHVCVKTFLMGKYPLSQMEWIMIMGKNPSANGGCGGFCPIENVSWNDTREFLQRLNARKGPKYRLPTEAEWEYAARSGGKAETWSGTSNPAELAAYAWFIEDSVLQTHPVGKKKPNGFGLYDMSGNVWEWTSDLYGASYYASSPEQDPTGPASGKLRVLRGGYWGDPNEMLRTTRRIALPPDARGPGYGLRLVQTTP